LFRELLPSGGLLSQYAVGSTPDSYKFLQRNYLIAAISLAVLVIEAPAKSGALRTAQHAAELGREVFVVPANLDNRNFYGSFQLIRDGATLVTHPEQILESLGIGGLFTPANEVANEPSSLADKILRVLSVDAVAPEVLVAQVDADPSDVLAELTVLEIDGLILRDGGKYAKKP
jgi:DNA processing protein